MGKINKTKEEADKNKSCAFCQEKFGANDEGYYLTCCLSCGSGKGREAIRKDAQKEFLEVVKSLKNFRKEKEGLASMHNVLIEDIVDRLEKKLKL